MAMSSVSKSAFLSIININEPVLVLANLSLPPHISTVTHNSDTKQTEFFF